jgi:hypothetical protein
MNAPCKPCLVGGIPTPVKTMKVKWDYCSKYMETVKNVPNQQPDVVAIDIFGVQNI